MKKEREPKSSLFSFVWKVELANARFCRGIRIALSGKIRRERADNLLPQVSPGAARNLLTQDSPGDHIFTIL